MTSPDSEGQNEHFDVQYSESLPGQCDLPTRAEVQRILKASLPKDMEVTVRFVDAAESRELNLRHLGKDRPANVLAFPHSEERKGDGDVAICPEVVATEAGQCNIATDERYAQLLVHASLHLLGMDHDSDEAAEKMERAEARLLSGLGFRDPYR